MEFHEHKETLADLIKTTQDERNAPNISFQAQVIAVVLVLSAVVGLVGSPKYLIFAIGVMGALFIVLKPPVGLIALLVAALVIPLQIDTGTQTSIHTALLLIPALFFVWLANMLRKGAIDIVPSQTNLPLFALSVIAVIAFIVGNLPWNYFVERVSLQAQLGGLSVFLFSVIAFFLAGNLIKDLRWLQILTWLFLVMGGTYIAGRIIPVLGQYSVAWMADGATGSLFWICLVALAWGQCLFNSRANWALRLVSGALAIATLAVGWFQAKSWASGWLPPLVAFGIIFWLRFPRVGTLLVASGIAIFAIKFSSILYVVSSDTHGTLFPFYARLAAWQIVLQAAKPNLLLGLGPSNYYNYVALYPIFGYQVRFSSHNNFVDLVAQTGLFGLAAFVWFIVEFAREEWSLRHRAKDGFVMAYVCASLGALVGILASCFLGDWFLPFVYNVTLKGFRASMLGWLFLGGLVAIKGIIESNSPPPHLSID
jgi:hypothetical protein